MKKKLFCPLLFLIFFIHLGGIQVWGEVDYLPSWVNGATKSAIVQFLESVSNPTSAQFVEPKDRIAVLDLDGTLMCEYPVNYQRAIAVKRLRELASEHVHLRSQQPFKAAWEDDGVFYNNKENHNFVFLKAFEGSTRDEYQKYVRQFLIKDDAPYWGRPFQKLFYQPALELVRYLEEKKFQVYVCSTTEEECIRDLLSEVLGMKPIQVIGNELGFKIVSHPSGVDFVLNGEFEAPECRSTNKCAHLVRHTGKRPIFAFGNSMGDCDFIRYCSGSNYSHFELIIDHDDAARELEYHDQALLKEAEANAWHVISMRRDFKTVFPKA